MGKGDFDKAIADFTEVIRLDPSFCAGAYECRGHAYVRKGDLEKGIADYTEAIRLRREAWGGDKHNAHSYLLRGSAYVEKGQIEKGLGDITEALRLNLNPEFASSAYGARGDAYLEKRDYDRAIADYTELIRLDPTGPNSGHYMRGLALDFKRGIRPCDSRLWRGDPPESEVLGCVLRTRLRLRQEGRNGEGDCRLYRGYSAQSEMRRGVLHSGPRPQKKGETHRADADFAAAKKLG